MLRITIIFLLLLWYTANAQKLSLTLDQTYQAAIQNAPLLKERQIQQQTAQIQIALTQRQLLPTVNGQYTNSLNLGRSIDP